mgnify:CR=1 FL=1
MFENEGPTKESQKYVWADVDIDEQDYLNMLLSNASWHYFNHEETKVPQNNQKDLTSES